jgi:serine protease inhibitor
MVKQVDSEVKAILISAVYFKSGWSGKFRKQDFKSVFNMESGVVETDFFYKDALDCKYYEAEVLNP